MNGAESLVRTLLGAGVDVCFTNPGTSEMQLVSAIDKVDGMRAILGLFEGVVTGAADGYARMARKPACTLLHLGPGLANGIANLHNARKGRVPVVNVVGEHALHHVELDAPLTADIEGLAGPVSHWVRTAGSVQELAPLGAEAVAAAGGVPGKIATLIVPADTAWTDLPEGAGPAPALPVAELPQAESRQIDAVARALKDAKNPVILLGGEALLEPGTRAAGRVAALKSVRLISETFNRRMQRGAGRVPFETLPYFGENALETLAGADLMILAGSKAPVAFFAYPGKPSRLVPKGCEVLELAGPEEDAPAALDALAEAMGAPAEPDRFQPRTEAVGVTGTLDAESAAHAVAAHLPEGAVVIDEGITSTIFAQPLSAGAAPHDWIQLTGGSIGGGLPMAVGAAVACPDRKVVCLEGDGSGMYTVQALWTMAREKLDVVSVIFANRSYAILNIELMRVGAENPGPKALSMLDIGRPDLSWTHIAQGMGVEATRAETAEEFAAQFADACARKGPRLIEAVL